MKLYLIFAFAAVLVTLASTKNINPEPSNNQELAEEANEIAENYAALEKERKEAVDRVNKGFSELENEREAEVVKIEDDITELEKDQKETVEEINANFANLEKEQVNAMVKVEEKIAENEEVAEIANAVKKVTKEWEEKQKEFELTRSVLDLPNIQKEIIAMDRRFSPAKSLEIFSDDRTDNPDGSLKSEKVTYRMQCDGFKNGECDRCTLTFNFDVRNFMEPHHVTSFKCGN